MGLYALIMALVVLAGLVLLGRALKDFMPGKKRMYEDLQALKEEMDNWAGELVPLTQEELDNFSFNQVKQSLKKRFSKRAKGIFTTIYHEPVLAYSYREYSGPGKKAVLFARTHDEDFAYIKSKDGVRIAIGQRELGTLKADGTLLSARHQKAIAEVSQAEGELLPVLVNDREVASVSRKNQAEREELGQRAFQFVKEDMSQEEKDIFLSLAVLKVVDQSLAL